nr:flagellin [uncultured Oscillibacter sp.]
MRIQHNIMAMNAYRNYNTNTSALSKNLEKLSSGYKINRAGDDAAGLAISEKMRAQITGLNAAQKNVKDGISLVKTAEGAMQEIQDMLNRMDYLATQSANGTYQDDVDRENLQKEVNQLLSEIDRIADSANFNGIKLLDGSLDTDALANAKTTSTVEKGTMTGLTADKLLPTTTNGVIGTNTIVYKKGENATKTKLEIDTSKLEWTATTAGDEMTITIGDATITLTATSANMAADGKVNIGNALTTAIPAGTTTAVQTGESVFNVTYASGKITLEMKDTPTANTDDGDLDPSWKITVAGDGTVKAQWNDGSLNMVRGVKPGDGALANTAITAANLGLGGTGAAADGKTIEIDGKTFVIVKEGGDLAKETISGATKVTVKADDTSEKVMEKLANAINSAGTVWSAGVNTAGSLTLAQTSDTDTAKNTTFSTAAGIAGTIKTGTTTIKVETTPLSTQQQNAKSLQLQIGDTSDTFNQLQVSVGDMHRAALGLNGLNIGTAQDASGAIAKIKNAINYVSGVRGDLGATQNRLEHTQNNLSVMKENIQDAESTIRDTDVAEEMMAYTKNNILVQSAQAMLAQANAVPQGVLQLLG